MAAANNTKTAKKVPGTPFKKGQSGNPKGRPKADPEVKEILKAASPAAAKKLVSLARSKNQKISLMACTEILDRTMGKPETTGKVQVDMVLSPAAILEQIRGRRE